MTHICVGVLGQHWFRLWLVAYSVPSHYTNQCCVIANWTLDFSEILIKKTKVFIHKNASENVVCEMAPILSRGDELNDRSQDFNHELIFRFGDGSDIIELFTTSGESYIRFGGLIQYTRLICTNSTIFYNEIQNILWILLYFTKNKSTLVQEIACSRNKPLLEPMLTQIFVNI